MNRAILISCLSIGIILNACKKDDALHPSPGFTKERISGVSQKGPFLNNSSLTIYELGSGFSQTGKSFNTQMLDNTGSFEIENLSLIGSFVKLKADGFYFNEITNANSLAPISLYALSDLENKNSVNVNLLTTLEVPRMEYLLDNGYTFHAAKAKAQQEVLKLIFVTKPDILESELLDIAGQGEDNAVLLAASLILQGNRTEAELSELLGDIGTDIRTDGVLNSSSLGTKLINDAKILNLSSVRNNIESRYADLGITTTVSDFEKYINQFIDSSTYMFTNQIQYPYIINSTQNLLADSAFGLSSQAYSFGAYLPKGTTLRVGVKPTYGNTVQYGWDLGIGEGWTLINYYPDSAFVTAVGNNNLVNVSFILAQSDSTSFTSLDFLIYENGTTAPTRLKTIHW